MVEEKVARTLRSRETGNFLSYVRARMDTFAERPLCTVDSLVFSWLAYTHLGLACDRACTARGVALHELLRAEDFDEMFGSSWDEQGSRDLLFAVCASPRFRAARLTDFRFKTDTRTEEQFAAMTFRLPDGSSYVAFRAVSYTHLLLGELVARLGDALLLPRELVITRERGEGHELGGAAGAGAAVRREPPIPVCAVRVRPAPAWARFPGAHVQAVTHDVLQPARSARDQWPRAVGCDP